LATRTALHSSFAILNEIARQRLPLSLRA